MYVFTWARRWGRYNCLTTSISPIASIRFTFADSYANQENCQNESTNDECHHQAEENEKHLFCGNNTFVEILMLSFEGIVKGTRMKFVIKFDMFVFEKLVIEQSVSHFRMWLCMCVWKHTILWPFLAQINTRTHRRTKKLWALK